MSAPPVFEGVPRELGFAQGRASARAVRAACGPRGGLSGALDRLGLIDARGRSWLRDVRRHFPHQAEWLEGAARGAGVPLPALVRAAAAALAAPPSPIVAFEGSGGVRLACAAHPDAQLRRVAPEGRFRSLELALPLLPSPQLGVNEAGLAVAATSGVQRDSRCAAPAALLARDCLERFDSVASALAWCLGRPAAPGAALLFADERGDVAGVELGADGRRVRRPEGGALALGGDAQAALAVSKRLAQGAPPDERALAELLGARSGACCSADPHGRRLAHGHAWILLDSSLTGAARGGSSG